MVTIDFFLLGASEVWNFLGPKMRSFEQIWKLYSKTVIISHTNLFKNAILGSTKLLANEIRLKVCQKSNIPKKNDPNPCDSV